MKKINISKNTPIFLVLIIVIFCAGCSGTESKYYYSPITDVGIKTKAEEYRDHSMYFFSSPDTILVKNESIELTLSIYEKDIRYFTIGPWWLTVIPVVPFCFFTYPEHPDSMRDDELSIDMDIKVKAKEATWDFSKVKLYILNKKQVLQPKDIKKITISRNIYSKITMKFQYPRKKIKVFDLHLDGITVNENEQVFPKIRFKKTKGWFWYFAP